MNIHSLVMYFGHFPYRRLLLLVATALVVAVSACAQGGGRRGGDDRVYLVHADRLTYDETRNPGAQCLAGRVHFRQGPMQLRSDSAVFYQATNSFEAFGHVHLTQADTLSLRGDYLFYDGESKLAQVRRNVVMRHREQTLHTDSLNYDRVLNTGYFFEGGKLVDGENTLTSDYGEYNTATRMSVFNYRVKLENKQFTLTSDTLRYDLRTKWAHTTGPSNINSGESRIYTTDAYYNTDSEQARLNRGSQLFNKGRKMVGDSLVYNKQTGLMKAFRNVVYDDTDNKNRLTGHYGEYNEQTGEAMATDSALVVDYSGADTLYVHADTLRLYTFNIRTDSAYRVMHAYYHVRAFRSDVQAVSDSLVYDSGREIMTLYRDPIVWSDQRQILGEEINVFFNDSTIDSVYVERQALLVERVDSIHFNQVGAHQMMSYFDHGEVYLNVASGNVCAINFPLEKDSLVLYQNYTETALLRMTLKDRKLKRLWTPSAKSHFYAAGLAPQNHTFLENFAWFDYIRPLSKDDLFEWRRKRQGTELKASVRREAPVQVLKR